MADTINAASTQAHVEELPETEVKEHERTYRKFVKLARIAAIGAPFFLGFLLYWTH